MPSRAGRSATASRCCETRACPPTRGAAIRGRESRPLAEEEGALQGMLEDGSNRLGKQRGRVILCAGGGELVPLESFVWVAGIILHL